MESKAWDIRKSARPRKGGTKVGCVILWTDGKTSEGANFVGEFGTSVHAEVCALAAGIKHASHKIEAILIASEANNFTPCGACLDWINQFSQPDTEVVVINKKDTTRYSVKQLMPFYPHR